MACIWKENKIDFIVFEYYTGCHFFHTTFRSIF